MTFPKRPWLLFRVMIAAVAALSLRWVGPRRFLRIVGSRALRPLFRMKAQDEPRLVAYSRSIASLWPFTLCGGECLVRSVAIFCFLRTAFSGVEIVFGVRHREGRLDGHAWIARDGRVFYDDPEVVGRYSPVYAYA